MTQPHEGSPEPGPETEPEEETPTVRDKRRVDPQTYRLRDSEAAGDDTSPAAAAGSDDVSEPGSPAGTSSETDTGIAQNDPDEVAALKQEVADRTADLQRIQAEYVNYKRRTDRDRDHARNSGVESVIRELLPVLDSVRYAREHDEVTGGFKGVADELDRLASKHGVEAFGAEGDPFDPYIHEALMNAEAEGITVATCVTVLQPGYKVGDRVVRPARVAVAEPQETSSSADGGAATDVSDSVADENIAPDGSADVVTTPGEPAGDAEAERHDDGTAGQ